MTSRQRFERWAKRNGRMLGRLQEVTRDGPRWGAYASERTQNAWLGWQASRRVFSARLNR